jgi:hypothetical protein
MRAFFFALAVLLTACGSSDPVVVPAVCLPGAPPLEFTGSVAPADAKTYRMLPFEVGTGSGRVELSYRWVERSGPPTTPASSTTLDLGLWDRRGYRNQAAFRGWGGSRQGRIDENDPPIFVQADSADRGFSPGAVVPGTWFAELGIAAVSPQGADWVVRVECKTAGGARPADDPVDPAHVASADTRWYHSDFHMHAYHSNPNAPDWDEFVALARAARLDFLMVTEYVTGRHWETLGAVQRAHPDLVVWPGREIITYYGHANTHGETFGLYDYRHGFEDVTLAAIQVEAKARGALFQVNHPTIFPPPTFSNFCRGCYFEQDVLQIDWAAVDTIEILTGPVLATGSEIGQPGIPGEVETPFMQAAIDLWEDLLSQGYKITAVSGSDSKGTETTDAERIRKGYGSSATAVYSAGLSRAALTEALRAGRAYVRTRGVDRSPALEYVAIAGTQEGMFGDTLLVGPTEPVTLRVTVTGGAGQLLRFLQNGAEVVEVPIPTDPYVHELPVTRKAASEGPLGTFWGIETRDEQSRTTIGNPIFLKGP